MFSRVNVKRIVSEKIYILAIEFIYILLIILYLESIELPAILFDFKSTSCCGRFGPKHRMLD